VTNLADEERLQTGYSSPCADQRRARATRGESQTKHSGPRLKRWRRSAFRLAVRSTDASSYLRDGLRRTILSGTYGRKGPAKVFSDLGRVHLVSEVLKHVRGKFARNCVTDRLGQEAVCQISTDPSSEFTKRQKAMKPAFRTLDRRSLTGRRSSTATPTSLSSFTDL
jgi:hypothetical protein